MPEATGDAYVCWGAEISRPTPTHVTGFAPRIDNATIVHHVVLFETTSAYSSTPTPCNSGASVSWRMVMGWAPGGKGLELPADVGFPIATAPQKTHYVVQMHYSNLGRLAGQKDKSGFELCTSPPRTYEADVVAFGTQSIDIPATGQPYTRDCTYSIPSALANAKLLAAMPHMHKLGTAMSTTLTPAGGGPEVDLGTDMAFSFSRQPWLPLPSVNVRSGDTVRTRCTWVNDTGGTVGFGEKTSEEMCYSFTLYYPRVNATLWSWALPATFSNCN